LVNISNELSGFAIGLFNYEREGIHNFEFWISEDSFAHLAFKFGTKHFYTVIAGGRSIYDEKNEWIVGIGWGFHIPINNFFFDIDAMCSSIIPDDFYETIDFQQTLLPSLRMKVGLKAFSIFAFFVGVDAQFYMPFFYDDGAYNERYSFEIPVYDNETMYIVPSLFAGIQLF